MANISRVYQRTRIKLADGTHKMAYKLDVRGERVPHGWQVKWQQPDGQHKSKRFPRRIDAARFASKTETDLFDGSYTTAQTTTLNDYLDIWLPAQLWRQSSRKSFESRIRNHIRPTIGKRVLGQIKRTDIQRWVTGLNNKGLAPATVRITYRSLSSAIGAAVADRIIPYSPAVKIRLPKTLKAHNSIVCLAVPDVVALSNKVPAYFAGFVRLVVSSGLRSSEAAGLTVDRIDLEGRQIIVDRQLVPKGGGRYVLGPLKSAASYRVIPIPDRAVAEIREHMATFPTVDLDGEPLVFSTPGGRPLSYATRRKAWSDARKALGFPPEAKGWHTLRHTYASFLIHAGLSVKTVQARLGHASASETLDTYAHLWPDTEDDTRAAVEAAFDMG